MSPVDGGTTGDATVGVYDIHKLMDKVVDVQGSDLHIRVGRPPTLRVNARMGVMDGPALTPADTDEMMKVITPQRNQLEFKEKGGTDFGMAHGDKGRYRVSVFRERGHVGIVLRLLPSRILTFEQIGLPDTGRQLLHRPRGLILVTGPTGSGKTTTLATMLDYINTNMDFHIVTIEDPIEYYHPTRSPWSPSARSGWTWAPSARRRGACCAWTPTSSSSARCATSTPSRRR